MGLLTIGGFARQAGLTPKALRLYDELGLLRPTAVDAESGYRFYEPGQLQRARLIAELRRIGMPLAEIADVCALEPRAAAEAVEAFWRRVTADTAARARLTSLLVADLSGRGTTMPEIDFRFAAGLDAGEGRNTNEDWVYAGEHLLAVADGTRGPGGAQAAAAAVDAVRALDPSGATGPDLLTLLAGAVTEADRAIRRLPASEPPSAEGKDAAVTSADDAAHRTNVDPASTKAAAGWDDAAHRTNVDPASTKAAAGRNDAVPVAAKGAADRDGDAPTGVDGGDGGAPAGATGGDGGASAGRDGGGDGGASAGRDGGGDGQPYEDARPVTTLTALLRRGTRLALVHVGDSRAYLLRNGELTQLTQDHTWVRAQVDQGRLTPAEAAAHPQRALLARALGWGAEGEVDLALRTALPGDRYLLCSDGLSAVVAAEDIGAALAAAADPQQAVTDLIALAYRAGAPDNIAVAVAHL
ncbi:MerR family transcriptional regulator [Actinoplanes sp. CA-054009]